MAAQFNPLDQAVSVLSVKGESKKEVNEELGRIIEASGRSMSPLKNEQTFSYDVPKRTILWSPISSDPDEDARFCQEYVELITQRKRCLRPTPSTGKGSDPCDRLAVSPPSAEALDQTAMEPADWTFLSPDFMVEDGDRIQCPQPIRFVENTWNPDDLFVLNSPVVRSPFNEVDRESAESSQSSFTGSNYVTNL